jgi:hypothetical protein
MKNKFKVLKGLKEGEVIANLPTKVGSFVNATIERNDTEHKQLHISSEGLIPLVVNYSDVTNSSDFVVANAMAYMASEFTKPNDNVEYFIFGEDACQVLLQGGMDELLSEINKEDSPISFALYEFDLSSPTPADMLNEFSGWGDYQLLTKENYLTLKNL